MSPSFAGSDDLVTVTGRSADLVTVTAVGEGARHAARRPTATVGPVLPPVRHAGTGRRDGGADSSYLPIRDDLDVSCAHRAPSRPGAPPSDSQLQLPQPLASHGSRRRSATVPGATGLVGDVRG